MTSEEYNGYKNWDTWVTLLILENTQSSQKWLLAWKKNFERKIAKGTFDKEQARKVVTKYIIPAARGKGPWAKHFEAVERGGWASEPDINPSKVDADEVIESILKLDE